MYYILIQIIKSNQGRITLGFQFDCLAIAVTEMDVDLIACHCK